MRFERARLLAAPGLENDFALLAPDVHLRHFREEETENQI